jgi:hypothetical protein
MRHNSCIKKCGTLLLALAIVFCASVPAYAQVQLGTNLSISAEVAGGATTGTGTTDGTTTTTTTTTGGGGGGSSPIYIPSATVNFSGRAYPLSRVVVLRDGAPVVSTIEGPDARFNISVTGVSAGTATFAVYGEDSDGRHSGNFSFPLIITAGVTVDISGIFISPTIAVDKNAVAKGDTVTIFGQSIPESTVVISIHSAQELFRSVATDANGAYLYKLDTSDLEVGDHTAQSKVKKLEDVSPYGKTVDFTVSQEGTVPEPTICGAGRGDLNCDTVVNFVDYSVMAYWYKKANPPARFDLNHDGLVNLIDFSILAYYWTW